MYISARTVADKQPYTKIHIMNSYRIPITGKWVPHQSLIFCLLSITTIPYFSIRKCQISCLQYFTSLWVWIHWMSLKEIWISIFYLSEDVMGVILENGWNPCEGYPEVEFLLTPRTGRIFFRKMVLFCYFLKI